MEKQRGPTLWAPAGAYLNLEIVLSVLFRGTRTIEKDKVTSMSGLGFLPAVLEAFPTPVKSWAVLEHSLDAVTLPCFFTSLMFFILFLLPCFLSFIHPVSPPLILLSSRFN